MLKKIVLSFLFLVAGFIIWMNITPGHFQYAHCTCDIGYYSDQHIYEQKKASYGSYQMHTAQPSLEDTLLVPIESIECFNYCPLTAHPVASILLVTSKLDFYP